MKNFTIITDPGIDDLVALVLLHKLGDKADNCLISTFGNASENITAQNAKEFISFVSPNWQFMHGSSKPFNNKFEHSWPDYFHGPDGVWGIHPKVNISAISSLTSYPKNENLISLAPLTEIYRLQQKTKPKKITIMGGVFQEEGNETKYAETNIAFDADSACHFFNEISQVQVKIVPLDVTRKVFWTEQEVNEIPETNDINIWLRKLLLTWFEKYSHRREKNFNLHDPLAVYLTYFPEVAKWVKSGVSIVTEGDKKGQTIFDANNPKCEIALRSVDPVGTSKKIYEIIFQQ